MIRRWLVLGAVGLASLGAAQTNAPRPVVIEAERPLRQAGSEGEDRKAGASEGRVLGKEFGGSPGHFAEYVFKSERDIAPARIRIRYARQTEGRGHLKISLDGRALSVIPVDPTGGWGDRPEQFGWLSLGVARISAGEHRLRLDVTSAERAPRPAPSHLLDLVGNRTDKQTVGHGKNVALFTGASARFWYATHALGNVFSAANGQTLAWYPDQVILSPETGNVNLDQIVIEADPDPGAAASAPGDSGAGIGEVRQVCVTEDDVIVSRYHLTNPSSRTVTHRIEIAGDCRGSADWRGGPGGEKITRRAGDAVVLIDRNVFPEILPEGLSLAVAGASCATGTEKPVEVVTDVPGAYRLAFTVEVPAGQTRIVTFACAVERTEKQALANLRRVLRQKDPVAQNRRRWEDFYEKQTPRFDSSDAALNELYAFRWFLLKISTAGGDLGYFRYPVVMEGREAFQTYCCYSAPFMAFDMNWAADPAVGFGHIANMGVVAYEDGRFPWYASPRTNRVPLDHPSASGLSALPMTAWRFYQIHGGKARLAAIYPWMKKNMEWWLEDRDADGNGLFDVDHQLETGMDDLHRRWRGQAPPRYEAIDATCYAYANLRAVAKMARELGRTADARRFDACAERSLRALNTVLWDAGEERWKDRNPRTGELSDYAAITMFYPLFADMAGQTQMGVVRRHLLDAERFWLPYPIPAISKADPEFDPVRRYWAGPSWPAATSHVVEGFANASKRWNRSLMPQAAELLRRSVRNHMTPRPDFYERYDPFTGRGLSGFRDYMHSWWIDIFIRHVAGLIPQDDGSLVIDPLPMGLERYSLRGAPHRGHRIDVLFNDRRAGAGLTVRRDGKVVLRDPAFRPGVRPVAVPR